MAQGSSCCSRKILVFFLCIMVFAHERGTVIAEGSREWPVGDNAGWSFGVLGWPNYKPFKTGDVLLFRYQKGSHNVVQVNVEQYSLCKVPANAPVWNSGNDSVTIARGVSFYISGFPGDCEKGMKIAVTAREP
ncbi:unnamed protein product [Urochloa humidicola]